MNWQVLRDVVVYLLIFRRISWLFIKISTLIILNNKICLNGVFLKQDFTVKHLGFYLDWNLSSKLHCDTVAAKVARGLGLIRSLRNEIEPWILMILYHCLISLYLSSSSLLWTSSFMSSLKKFKFCKIKLFMS
jgi:hypothetical protein